MGRTKATSDAKQRILDTADRLFYAEGVRAVGIDRIIAESGVAKMTLYAHFRSKDDLILAVLRYREEQFMTWFGQAMERPAGAGMDRLGALLAALKGWFETPEFQGVCIHQRLGRAGRPGPPRFRPCPTAPGAVPRLPVRADPGIARRVGCEADRRHRPVDRGAIVTALMQARPDPPR